MERSKLTPKQEKFATRYMECGNATQAYKDSYNAEKMLPNTVTRKANELLNNEKVNGYIAASKAVLAKRSILTKEMIIKSLMSIVNDYNDFKQMAINLPMDADTSALEDKIKILQGFAKSTDAIAALKQISSMLGFNTPEKVEVDHSITININRPKED